jgi:hypothetical protein
METSWGPELGMTEQAAVNSSSTEVAATLKNPRPTPNSPYAR